MGERGKHRHSCDSQQRIEGIRIHLGTLLCRKRKKMNRLNGVHSTRVNRRFISTTSTGWPATPGRVERIAERQPCGCERRRGSGQGRVARRERVPGQRYGEPASRRSGPPVRIPCRTWRIGSLPGLTPDAPPLWYDNTRPALSRLNAPGSEDSRPVVSGPVLYSNTGPPSQPRVVREFRSD